MGKCDVCAKEIDLNDRENIMSLSGWMCAACACCTKSAEPIGDSFIAPLTPNEHRAGLDLPSLPEKLFGFPVVTQCAQCRKEIPVEQSVRDRGGQLYCSMECKVDGVLGVATREAKTAQLKPQGIIDAPGVATREAKMVQFNGDSCETRISEAHGVLNCDACKKPLVSGVQDIKLDCGKRTHVACSAKFAAEFSRHDICRLREELYTWTPQRIAEAKLGFVMQDEKQGWVFQEKVGDVVNKYQAPTFAGLQALITYSNEYARMQGHREDGPYVLKDFWQKWLDIAAEVDR